MDTHTKLLAWLNIILGGLILAVGGGFALWILLEGGEQAEGWAFMFAIIAAIAGGPSLVGGLGYRKGAGWARIVLVIASILMLSAFPVGTALGICGLYVLLIRKATPLAVA
jgi:hypothetical protein